MTAIGIIKSIIRKSIPILPFMSRALHRLTKGKHPIIHPTIIGNLLTKSVVTDMEEQLPSLQLQDLHQLVILLIIKTTSLHDSIFQTVVLSPIQS